MCSIFGFICSEPRADAPELLRKIAHCLRHRGPDDSGFFSQKLGGHSLHLGMTRLSIVDRAHGAQPFFSDDRSMAIVFNGEIYNHQSLRQELLRRGYTFTSNSDTEVVLKQFQEFGIEGFVKLNGMFAFAVFDLRREKLYLARDRFGVKPLLYTTTGPFSFASEARAFKLLPWFEKQISPQALADYFSLGYVPTPNCMYQGIAKLEPASWLCVQADGSIESRGTYWSPDYREVSGTEVEFAETFRSLLNRSVHAQLMGEVPVGVFLSGGLDSTAIAAQLAANNNIPYKTFSVSFDEPEFNERPLIETFLKRYNANNAIINVSGNDIPAIIPEVTRALDEPLGFTAYPYYLLCQRAKQDVTVVLAGDGGDELFGGYDTYYAPPLLAAYRYIPAILRRIFCEAFLSLYGTRHGKRGLDMKVAAFTRAAELNPARAHISWREYFSEAEKRAVVKSTAIRYDIYPAVAKELEDTAIEPFLNRMLYSDMRYFLQETCLSLADRIGMAHSLEVRVPFLDNDLFDFAASLPSTMKVRGCTTKVLPRLALNEILPQEIISAPKLGFAPPFGKWIRGPLHSIFNELAHDNTLHTTALIDGTMMRRLLDEHCAGKRDHTRKLMLFFGYLNWHRYEFQDQ